MNRPEAAYLYNLITKRAYTFFEERGRQHGHDVEDWLRAEAAILAVLVSTHRVDQYTEWVNYSHKLATLFPTNAQEQIGCVTTIQKLARFERVIDGMEIEYDFRRLRGIPEQPGELDDIVTYTYLWVLGAYEIVRTLAKKTGNDRIREVKQQFARIRVPLAKLEASSKYEMIDYNFPEPVIALAPFRVGWAIHQKVFVSRLELSDFFLDAVKEFFAGK